MSTNINEQFVVDLRSDTVTKPTQQMKTAMINAELGDDVFREDPTVKRLETIFAKIMDKEAALFVPSGSMGNLISAMVHCSERGAEAIIGDKSHMFDFEQGSLAQVAGIHPRVLRNQNDGTIDIEEVKNSIRRDDIHEPYTGLICIENTQATCGGKVLPQEYLRNLYAFASERKIPVHMDGARLFNAAAHLKIPASDITKYCDSVSVCFSKGLCAPVGSALAGSKQFIDGALRIRKLLGGAMRQVGVLAAAAIVALDTVVEKLPEDNRRAKAIAKAVSDMTCKGIHIDEKDVQTNIAFLKFDEKIAGISAEDFVERLQKVSEEELLELKVAIVVKMLPFGLGRIRYVLHPDITDHHVEMAIKKLQFVINEVKSVIS